MRAEVLKTSNRYGRINSYSLTTATRRYLLDLELAKDYGGGVMQLTESGMVWCGLKRAQQGWPTREDL